MRAHQANIQIISGDAHPDTHPYEHGGKASRLASATATCLPEEPRHGEVAVITGGTGGIGTACAEEWLDQGGSVVICDLDEVKGKAFEQKYPGRVRFVRCDVRKKEDLEVAGLVACNFGILTCWLNNAGLNSSYDTVDAHEALDNLDAIISLVDVNTTAGIVGTYVALKNFDSKRGGVVINTSSMAALLPRGAAPVYAASKAGIAHFTRAFASLQGDTSNIRTYALCPTYVPTGMGPPPEFIKKALGGVLTARHIAQGFAHLVKGDLPNGSIMRVTVRNNGTEVVHDLVQYGKEFGGPHQPRPGHVIQSQELAAYDKNADPHYSAHPLEVQFMKQIGSKI